MTNKKIFMWMMVFGGIAPLSQIAARYWLPGDSHSAVRDIFGYVVPIVSSGIMLGLLFWAYAREASGEDAPSARVKPVFAIVLFGAIALFLCFTFFKAATR
jgi:hypothetical protein